MTPSEKATHTDRIAAFWSALGALTFAETIEVAETLRDAAESTADNFGISITEWSFLLNTAREIAELREDA